MTDEELAAIRARAEAATPGPWVTDDIEPWFVFDTTFNGEIAEFLGRTKRRLDSAFIAHAREDVPALLAEVERLRARDAAMREIVEAMADAGPMIPPFDQYDGAIMERFVTKARALLAKDEERDK